MLDYDQGTLPALDDHEYLESVYHEMFGRVQGTRGSPEMRKLNLVLFSLLMTNFVNLESFFLKFNIPMISGMVIAS